MARAKQFYGSIFGWELADYPMADGSQYVGARSVAVDEATHLPKEPGAINGGIVPRSAHLPAPVLAMNVSSVDEYVTKIEAAGGKVVKPKVEIGGMGYYAYVSDTEGNVIGLWEDIKKA
jgi:predicted enzyme related to lactoylglutathione lyase